LFVTSEDHKTTLYFFLPSQGFAKHVDLGISQNGNRSELFLVTNTNCYWRVVYPPTPLKNPYV